MNIYVARDGQTFGPYTPEHALGMMNTGELVANDLACPEGANDWVPLGQILGLPTPAAAPLRTVQPMIPVAQPATAVPPPGFTGPPAGYSPQQPVTQPAHQAAAPGALPHDIAPGSPRAAMVVRQAHSKAAAVYRNMGLCAMGFVFAIGWPILALIIDKGGLIAAHGGKNLVGMVLWPFDVLTLVGSFIVGLLGAALFGWLYFRMRGKADTAKVQFLETKRAAGY